MRGKRALIFILIANAVLLLLFAASALGYRHYAGLLDSQQAAARWRGDSDIRFGQVSDFRPVGEEVSLNDVAQFRAAMEKALTEASVDLNDGLSKWTDAWSARGKLTVKGDRGSTETTAYAVGGSFFSFHPLQLISGSYLTEEDLARDGVVLTRDLAWSLFGATDVAGMSVTIDGVPRMVIGVVDVEKDTATTAASAPSARIYLHYDSLWKPADKKIDCYELILADPITGFAKKTVTDSFSTGGEVVENSARYRLGNIWQVLRKYGYRSMNTLGVVYPYWENAARYTEDMAARMLLFLILTGLIPVLCVIAACVLGFVFLRRQGRRMVQKYRMLG